MSAIICDWCKRIIGNYASPQRWHKGRAYHPQCYAPAVQKWKQPVDASPFTIAGVTFLRCPDCASACTMKASTGVAQCRCGRSMRGVNLSQGAPDPVCAPKGAFAAVPLGYQWWAADTDEEPSRNAAPTAAEVIVKANNPADRSKAEFFGALVNAKCEEIQREINKQYEDALRYSPETPMFDIAKHSKLVTTNQGPNAKTRVEVKDNHSVAEFYVKSCQENFRRALEKQIAQPIKGAARDIAHLLKPGMKVKVVGECFSEWLGETGKVVCCIDDSVEINWDAHGRGSAQTAILEVIS